MREVEQKYGQDLKLKILFTFDEFPSQVMVSTSFEKQLKSYETALVEYTTQYDSYQVIRKSMDPDHFITTSLDFSFEHLKLNIDYFGGNLTERNHLVSQTYPNILKCNETLELDDENKYELFKSSKCLHSSDDTSNVKTKLDNTTQVQRIWNDEINNGLTELISLNTQLDDLYEEFSAKMSTAFDTSLELRTSEIFYLANQLGHVIQNLRNQINILDKANRHLSNFIKSRNGCVSFILTKFHLPSPNSIAHSHSNQRIASKSSIFVASYGEEC